ncbi:MAG: hypothetical protein GY913_07745 [Proteobacteria bacterium]|nr:hypothetical protein [Pseudomonadota bacterium]MCP4916804.1 hypothetical protein [Pseudomonadota bacterium]
MRTDLLRTGLASLALLTLTGCFGELFAGRTVYMSTEYLIEQPRIGGISLDPPRLEAGREYELSWLMLAPEDAATLGDVTVTTCGLGRDVPTYIWDLNCFQIPDEVTPLATGSGVDSVTFTPPDTPTLDDCNAALEEEQDDIPDSWGDTGWRADDFGCAHQLPILIEAEVDGTPTFAASFVEWFPEAQDEEMPPAARTERIAIQAPDSGAAGETVEVTLVVAGDHRRGEFQWYVDGGVLENTGWTAAATFVDDDPAWPDGYTTTLNRWTLPDEGEPRVFAVLPSSDGWEVYAANSTWAGTRVEVR